MGMERITSQIGERDFIIETGKLAKQAHGAVLLQYGETVVLATAVSEKEADPGKDFFPLTIDYREKLYAAGKIPGGYFKREGRPSTKETLTSRLIDRPIRSVFIKDYHNETQVLLNVVSFDGENDPDIVAMNAASAALIVSDIPFENPVGAVRVGLIDGELIVNPTIEQLVKSDLDLVVAGTREKIVMIEAGAREVPEDMMIKALFFGHEQIKKICAAQDELRKKAGKPKREVVKTEVPEALKQKIAGVATNSAFKTIFDGNSKEERESALDQFYKEKVLAQFDPAAEDFCEKTVKAVFEKLEKAYVREMIVKEGRRPDGRSFRDIREISCEVGVLPRTHGSSLFTRGQTQALCVTTLGTGADEQRIEALEGEVRRRFLLHYNFPPSSVGETGRTGGTGRREIGHGALAERALAPVMPYPEEFPYVVRLVSDILESNGSSSMATVCGGTLALMDAGVPLRAPVAGIAIGLIEDSQGSQWKVLTDIAGIEDFLGDMDFKAAGTTEGLTALQMDLKIAGISEEILREAFDHAKEARFKILEMITATIPTPRAELSAYAPRIKKVQINPDKIGALIGPGGKVIRALCDETGAKVDIDDSGTVTVASTNGDAMELALKRIREITAEAEIGAIYQGTVRKLMAFGAFCEIIPGQDGLCHVSEVSDGFVKDVGEYLRVGDVVPVKVIGIENGKINLSIKQAKPGGVPKLAPEDQEPVGAGDRGPSRDRGPRRDRGGPRRR